MVPNMASVTSLTEKPFILLFALCSLTAEITSLESHYSEEPLLSAIVRWADSFPGFLVVNLLTRRIIRMPYLFSPFVKQVIISVY